MSLGAVSEGEQFRYLGQNGVEQFVPLNAIVPFLKSSLIIRWPSSRFDRYALAAWTAASAPIAVIKPSWCGNSREPISQKTGAQALSSQSLM